jgi:hypothetical protein
MDGKTRCSKPITDRLPPPPQPMQYTLHVNDDTNCAMRGEGVKAPTDHIVVFWVMSPWIPAFQRNTMHLIFRVGTSPSGSTYHNQEHSNTNIHLCKSKTISVTGRGRL